MEPQVSLNLTSLLAKLVPAGVKRRIMVDALTQGEAAVRAELSANKSMPPVLNLVLTAIAGGVLTNLLVYFGDEHACVDLTLHCVKRVGAAAGAGALASVINLLRQFQTDWDGYYRRPSDPPNTPGPNGGTK